MVTWAQKDPLSCLHAINATGSKLNVSGTEILASDAQETAALARTASHLRQKRTMISIFRHLDMLRNVVDSPILSNSI